MLELGEKILSLNIENRKEYIDKFEKLVMETKETSAMLKGEDDNLVCPKCGSKLVLRTATKGPNVGNKFYGCSSFPKCKYIKNV